MGNTTPNNPFTMKNNTNSRFGGAAFYQDSQNIDANMKYNIQINNTNDFNYEPGKKKNILAAIDLNKNYYDKKRPYSASKPIKINNHFTQNSNLNKARSAKSKVKAHDNLDLGNFQDLRNINADYYQALIDKITKEYGNIDAELIQEYIRNLENENNIQINDENNNNDNLEGNVYGHQDIINNHEISEINPKNNSAAVQHREDIGDENEENLYNQEFENN